MGFDRVSAKLAARESMRINRPNPILVTLVYFLLTSLLASVISYLLYDPLNETLQYLSWGYEPEEILDFILREHGSELVLYNVVQLLLGIYAAMMSVGYLSYSLRMARNEQPGYSRLFDGFVRPFRVLATLLLVSVFTFLWSLVVLLPLTALLLVMGLLLESDAATLVSIAVSGSMAMLGVMVAVTYRYRLSLYFLMDDPGCTAREAIRRSREAMRGRKLSLFALDVSFFGWALLSMLVSALISLVLPVVIMDVLAFWVMPYRFASVANFYDSVTGAKAPSGGSVGPDYPERHPDDGPVPF